VRYKESVDWSWKSYAGLRGFEDVGVVIPDAASAARGRGRISEPPTTR
jgi:hypothetical protein